MESRRVFCVAHLSPFRKQNKATDGTYYGFKYCWNPGFGGLDFSGQIMPTLRIVGAGGMYWVFSPQGKAIVENKGLGWDSRT